MDGRTAGAMVALAVAAVGTAWWILQPSARGSSTESAVREPVTETRTARPQREPDRIRQLTDVGMTTPARSALPKTLLDPSAHQERIAGREDVPDEGVQSERFAALIDRARDTIWQRGEELGLPESDIQATVGRVEDYLKQMDHIRTEVRAGRLDRRVAKEQLTAEREALHEDLDTLVGPETHEALKGAIPAKY